MSELDNLLNKNYNIGEANVKYSGLNRYSFLTFTFRELQYLNSKLILVSEGFALTGEENIIELSLDLDEINIKEKYPLPEHFHNSFFKKANEGMIKNCRILNTKCEETTTKVKKFTDSNNNVKITRKENNWIQYQEDMDHIYDIDIKNRKLMRESMDKIMNNEISVDFIDKEEPSGLVLGKYNFRYIKWKDKFLVRYINYLVNHDYEASVMFALFDFDYQLIDYVLEIGNVKLGLQRDTKIYEINGDTLLIEQCDINSPSVIIITEMYTSDYTY